jgi:hypothetical protein
MPQELIPVTYQDSKGQTQTTHLVRGKPMTRRMENFCRMVASGEYDPLDAYCKAYEKELTPLTSAYLAQAASHLMGQTQVVLRIQQLRTPVLPEIARKYTYNLNKAMDECQTAWDLAFAQGHVGHMIKLIELRSRLNKMLSEQIDVTHKHGFLDDTATQVLLEMKKQLEEARAKKKRLAAPVVTVEAQEVA